MSQNGNKSGPGDGARVVAPSSGNGANRHLGAVPVRFGAKEVTFRFTWDVHAKLLDIWGPDYEPDASWFNEPKKLAQSVAVISAGAIGEDEVWAANPWMMPLLHAVIDAVRLGFLGPPGADEGQPAAPAGDQPDPMPASAPTPGSG